MASFLSSVLRNPEVSWQLRNIRTGATLASRIEFAFDSETRRRGLLGRTTWEDGSALVIAPSNAIHMFFMKFPIDVVFVKRSGVVVKYREQLGRWRVSAAMNAYAVIELPAGTLAQHPGIRIGDTMEFVRQ